jgi:hypothetical protein
MEKIYAYVKSYRAKLGIKPTPGRKDEPSCIMLGEGHNLLYYQLITTPEGTGGWRELQHEDVRQLVLEEIAKTEKT